MKRTIELILVLLVLMSSVSAYAQVIDSVYYERLFYTCKAWGHVKYYHTEPAKGEVEKEGFSMQSAQVTVDQIWGLASRMGKQKYFVDERIGYVTDDHRFIIEKANIPMVDIINVQENGSFGDYHHKHDDNIDIISKATLGAVGQVVTAYIYNEANGDNEVDVKY